MGPEALLSDLSRAIRFHVPNLVARRQDRGVPVAIRTGTTPQRVP